MEFIPMGDLFSNFHAPNPQLTAQKNKLNEQLNTKNQRKEEALKISDSKQRDAMLKAIADESTTLETRLQELIKQQNEFDEKNLSWKLRYRVCRDVARGISYLHNIFPPIIHRDLRSPNVFVSSFLKSCLFMNFF